MKKIMSILLTLAMVCTFAVVPVSAETTLTQDSDGYYEIATADDYMAFVTLVNDGNYLANARLKADINLSGLSVSPIGTHAIKSADRKHYSGTFDGQGHVVRNLTMTKTYWKVGDAGFAMFAQLSGATIKNLGIENATITVTQSKDKDNSRLGILACWAEGTTSITNCYVKDSSITYDGNGYVQAAGPIAGCLGASATISNCYAIDCSIAATAKGSGGAGSSGFVGYISASTNTPNISNSYAKNVTLTNFDNIFNFARFGTKNSDPYLEDYEKCYSDKAGKSKDIAVTVVSDSTTPSWSTLHTALGETAWKADTNNLNGGAPRLKWETDPAVYSVTAATAENGSVTVDKTEAIAGATVTVTVTPAAGYMIGEVKYNDTVITAEDGVYSFEMPAEAVTVTATFVEETKYSVNITAGNGGTVTVDPTSFVPGATVTLNVTPANEGFTAVVTKDGETLDAPYKFTMPAADVAISVTFTAPWNGLGTEADPFIIADASDLQELAVAANTEAHFTGVYFELANDIDCGDVFTVPIANATTDTTRDNRYFSGIFDGKNYVIKNFTSDKENRRYVALFGHLKNATVKNLGLENVTAVMSGTTIADVATLGALVEDSVISDCYAKDSSLSVKRTVTDDDQKGHAQQAGGLVAEATDTTFTNCYTQNITISQTGGAKFSGCAGGFVGYLKGTSKAENCYSANITFKNIGTSGNAAYFARKKDENVQIVNCFRTGNGGKDDASAVRKTVTELHSSALLGSAFVADFDKVNGGYPMLAWEVTEAPAYKIILTGVGKDENGVITNVTFETYNGFASGKVYVAVMNGARFVKAVTADMAAGTVDIEDITLADGETINVFVWDGVNPLMFAEKGLN